MLPGPDSQRFPHAMQRYLEQAASAPDQYDVTRLLLSTRLGTFQQAQSVSTLFLDLPVFRCQCYDILWVKAQCDDYSTAFS